MSNWVKLHRIKSPGVTGGVAYEPGYPVEVNLDQIVFFQPTDEATPMRGHTTLFFGANSFIHVWEDVITVGALARTGLDTASVKQAVSDELQG